MDLEASEEVELTQEISSKCSLEEAAAWAAWAVEWAAVCPEAFPFSQEAAAREEEEAIPTLAICNKLNRVKIKRPRSFAWPVHSGILVPFPAQTQIALTDSEPYLRTGCVPSC